VNGFRIEISASDGEVFIIKNVIQKKCDLQSIAGWLEIHMRRKKVGESHSIRINDP
jgi:hypothetical protein